MESEKYSLCAGCCYKMESVIFRENERLKAERLKDGLVERVDGEVPEQDPLLEEAEGAAIRFKWGLVKYFGFKAENVTLLLDRNDSKIGTADNIMNNLDAMIGKARPRDKVLFFYCGHGGSDNVEDKPPSDKIRNYYMSCSEDTYITGSRLLRSMKSASKRSVELTIILDCCYSSGLFQGLAAEQIPPLTHGYKLSGRASSAIMTGSSRRNENSFGGDFHKRKRLLQPCYSPVISRTFRLHPRKRRVVKWCKFSSSNFVESLLTVAKKAIKKANGHIPQNKSLMNLITKELKNGYKNLQQPQLFCTNGQAIMRFSC